MWQFQGLFGSCEGVKQAQIGGTFYLLQLGYSWFKCEHYENSECGCYINKIWLLFTWTVLQLYIL